VASSLAVGLILGVGSFSGRQLQEEGGWLALGFASPLFFSVLLNRAFLGLRRKNMELHAAMEEMAYTDPLTGIDNRRSLLEKIEARAVGDSGWFLMIDLDDFKKINDDFGHDVGDLVLRDVAGVLAHCPAAMFAGRLGGEEFGVYCAADGPSGAETCAAWLIDRVNALSHEGRRISVSVGIAWLGAAARIGQAMKQADEALYQAKQAGKNCFAFAPSSGGGHAACRDGQETQGRAREPGQAPIPGRRGRRGA
jgi:diguanylate cyclase (GGDEF)-like protein